MSQDDYLWDKSGEADPELQKLEQVLGRLQSRPAKSGSARRMGRVTLVAAAAAAALLVIWPAGEKSSWRQGESGISAGALIEPGQLVSESIGSLRVESGTRLRWKGGNRFTLEQGEVHALVWAPPREFVIDTPSAKAVDLGCQYTLRVGEDGGGMLRVETGWVALEHGKREAFVPAGAECRTRKGKGPGTPYFVGSSEGLKIALHRWDDGDRAALPAVLASAGDRDGLSLWHLLAQVDGADRRLVVDRLGAVVKLEDKSGILRGDPKAMDRAWEALGLGGADWWRGWKQPI